MNEKKSNLLFFITIALILALGIFAHSAREWNVGPNFEYLFQPGLHKNSVFAYGVPPT